jgi:hypothetical protein
MNHTDFISSTLWQSRCAAISHALAAHIGAANGLNVKRLADAVGLPDRAVRRCVEHMRLEGRHICGKPPSRPHLACANRGDATRLVGRFDRSTTTENITD